MGIHCDNCGHYIARADEKCSKKEWEHIQFMHDLKLDRYVALAIEDPSLIESWENSKAEMAKDLTSVDCNFPHLFLDEIKESLNILDAIVKERGAG